MPYDYYDYFKKQRESPLYTETAELVRQNLWSETINFRQSQDWICMENKILIRLYHSLRYS